MARKIIATAFECNQLGVTFFRCGAVDLAIEHFKCATKRAPFVSSYWLNLGVALLEKGILTEAAEALEKAISINPENQSAYFHRAQLHKKFGHEVSVRCNYEKVIEIKSDTRLAQLAREYLEGWRPRIIRGGLGD
jgi:Tfp pilus assembly protein PilF